LDVTSELIKFKANYHTHHELCRHAEGTTEDYVKEAIRCGFKELGMSDHAYSYLINDYGVRMKPEEFPIYNKDIEDNILKYQDKIKIYKGFEVEFIENNNDYYNELLEKVEYLILGQHYISFDSGFSNPISSFALVSKEEIIEYARMIEKALETKYFTLLAHPDLYMCGYKEWDETAIEVAHTICKAAKKANIPVEYNANGFRRRKVMTTSGLKRPYPREEFFEIVKEYDLEVIISSDCHVPELLCDEYLLEAVEALDKQGIKRIDFLKIK